MTLKFDWKKKTAIYIGRFQPFHDGHKKLFLHISCIFLILLCYIYIKGY